MLLSKQDGTPRTPLDARQVSYLTLFGVVIILTLGFYLRYQAANHEYISQWDEAYHALVAKNLTLHPLMPTLYDVPLMRYDAHNWLGNHVWLHKPPLALWMMSLAIAVGGEREIVFRLPSVFLSTISILLTWLIGKELLGNAAGIAASALQALNPLFIRLVAGTIVADHVDTALIFFVEITFLALIIAAKKKSGRLAVLSGVLLGCALLTKSLPALVVLAAAPLFRREKKHMAEMVGLFGLVLFTAAAVVAPWKIYTALSWPQESAWENQYTIRHLFEVIEEHDHPANWYISLIPTHYGGPLQYSWVPAVTYIVVLSSICYALYFCYKKKDRNLFTIVAWALLPYIVFSFTRTKVISFVAIGVPAVLLLIGFSIEAQMALFKRAFSEGKRLKRVTAVGGILVTLAFVIPLGLDRLAADYSVCPWNFLYDYPTFRTTMLKIRKIPGQKVILNVGDNKAIQAMYYTGCTAYSDLPSSEELLAWIGKGYKPFIVTDEANRNADKILLLFNDVRLKDQLTLLGIAKPRVVDLIHPYFN